MLTTPIYIDPVTDYGFKLIFGSETNKDLLIALLNGFFRGRKNIVDLVYVRNEHVGDGVEIGTVIFDLMCTTVDGAKFVIEVQRTAQVNLKRRMLYYGSKIIADQAPKGNRKAWNYEVTEVYVIVLMDGFVLPDAEESQAVMHDICLCNRETCKVFYEDLGFIYVQLRNFTKAEHELESDLDRWLYVLRDLSKLDKLPIFLRKSIFEKLFKIAEYCKLNKEERTMYDVSLKRKWDQEAVRQYQEQEQKKRLEEGFEQGMQQGIQQGLEQGIEQGIQKGIEQGIQKGIEQGIQKGVQQGMQQGVQQGIEQGREIGLEQGLEQGRCEERAKAEAEKKSAALKMLAGGFAVEVVADMLGLSIEDVEKLK